MPGRRIVIHSLTHAQAALAAAREVGVPVVLVSAPGAAGYAGAGWFGALVAAARAEFPEVAAKAVLDCGADAGYALAALREGAEAVRLGGRRAAVGRVAEIAAARGAELDRGRGAALDLLGVADPAAACREWLAKGRRRTPAALQKPGP